MGCSSFFTEGNLGVQLLRTIATSVVSEVFEMRCWCSGAGMVGSWLLALGCVFVYLLDNHAKQGQNQVKKG